MPTELPLDIRWTAEELYIVDGLTYAQVAEKTGVSVSQLQRWGQADNWGDRRQEYRDSIASIKRDTMLLRARLIKKAMGSLDPQDVYAVARLEAAAAKAITQTPTATTSDTGSAAAGADPVRIESAADAVAALSEVIERKLAGMIRRPDAIDLKSVQQLKSTIELVEKMRAKYAAEQEADKPRGIDADTLAEIRQKINLL